MGSAADSDTCDIITPGEVELYVQTLQCYTLKDVGSKKWWQQYEHLQELNLQAAVEAQQMRHEAVKEFIVTLGKLVVLVSEAITGELWRQKVFPSLQKVENSFDSSFPLEIVLHHEAAAVALLSIVLFHPDAREALESAAADLADYCCRQLSCFAAKMTLKSEDDKEGEGLEDRLGQACVSIVRYLSEEVDNLTPSVASFFFRDNDLPLLLASLLEAHFASAAFKRLQEEEEGRVSKEEAQLWLALHSLLLSRSCLTTPYDLSSSYRRERLLKLMTQVNRTTLQDQLPLLVELQHWLAQVGAGALPSAGTSLQQKPACYSSFIQVVPQIKAYLMDPYEGRWEELVEMQREVFMEISAQELRERAKSLSKTFSIDNLESFLPPPHCVKCGNLAANRCSRCHSEWYCRRQCQVEHWPKHQKMCDLIASVE